MKNHNQKPLVYLFLLITVQVLAIYVGAYAYFSANIDTAGTVDFKTVTASKSYSFSAYSENNISINITAPEMGESNVSTDIVANDNATIVVELASPSDDITTICNYDIAWVWDSSEKYITASTKLPYINNNITYPYEFSVRVDDKNEINLSNLTWLDEENETDKYAIIAQNLSITATSTEVVKNSHIIDARVYNIPVDQKALFDKGFLGHLELRNYDCQMVTGPILKLNVTSKTSTGIEIEATIEDDTSIDDIVISYYYKLADSNEWITLKENTNDLQTHITGLSQDKDYSIKVVAENEFGKSEYTITVKTESATDISLKDGVVWQEDGSALIEFITEDPNLNIKYKINNEDEWHNYDGPITNLHHGDIVQTILIDGETEISQSNFNIADDNKPSISANIGSTSAYQGQSIILPVTISDSESGITISESKWYIDKTNELVGIDNPVWTSANSFTNTPQDLEILPDEPGTYYIHILAVDNANNKYEQKYGPFTIADGIAETGGVKYGTIQAAIDTIPANNSQTTVNLLADTAEDSIVISSNQNVLLDLNTHTIDSSSLSNFVFQNNTDGKFSITNGTVIAGEKNAIVNSGKLNILPNTTLYNNGLTTSNDGYPTIINSENGNATINGANITSDLSTVLYNSGTMNVTDSSLTANGLTAVYNEDKITLNNVTATANNNCIETTNDSSTTITNGNFTSSLYSALYNLGYTKITGQTTFSANYYNSTIYNNSSSDFSMTGGYVISSMGDSLYNISSTSTVTFTDTTFKTGDSRTIYNSGTLYLKGNTQLISDLASENTVSNDNTIYNAYTANLYLQDNTTINGKTGITVYNDGNLYVSDLVSLDGNDKGPTVYNRSEAYITGNTTSGPTISNNLSNAISNHGNIELTGAVNAYTTNDNDTNVVVGSTGGTIKINGANLQISGVNSLALYITGGDLSINTGNISSQNNPAAKIEGGSATINGGTFTSNSSNALNVNSYNTIYVNDGHFISYGYYPTIFIHPGASLDISKATINASRGNAVQNEGNITVSSSNVVMTGAADYNLFVNQNGGYATLNNVSLKAKYNSAIENNGNMTINGSSQILDGNSEEVIVYGIPVIRNNYSGYLEINDTTYVEGLNCNAIANAGTLYINDSVHVDGKAENYPTLFNDVDGYTYIVGSTNSGPTINNNLSNAIGSQGYMNITGKASIYNIGDEAVGAMALANQGTLYVDGANISSTYVSALVDFASATIAGKTTITTNSAQGSLTIQPDATTTITGGTFLNTSYLTIYSWGSLEITGTSSSPVSIKSTYNNALVNEVGAKLKMNGTITIENTNGDGYPAFVNAGYTEATGVTFISDTTAVYNIEGTVKLTNGAVTSRSPEAYYALINMSSSGATTTLSGTTLNKYRADQ